MLLRLFSLFHASLFFFSFLTITTNIIIVIMLPSLPLSKAFLFSPSPSLASPLQRLPLMRHSLSSSSALGGSAFADVAEFFAEGGRVVRDNLTAELPVLQKALPEGSIQGPTRAVSSCHFVELPPPPASSSSSSSSSPTSPSPLYLIAASPPSLSLLHLPLSSPSTPSFLSSFSSLHPSPPSSSSRPHLPYATAYGCHCGTQYFGQLGDGRAATIHETSPSPSRVPSRFEVQLKGAGATPFSRGFDGRAALRGCVREMLGCEGLAGLGVPTQRVLAVVGTSEVISRPWYTAGSAPSSKKFPPAKLVFERAAVLTRFAPSFLRFGHFELHAERSEHDLLNALIDHALEVEFPDISGPRSDSSTAAMLEAVVDRQAFLVAEWLRVGYCEG